jgi:hypothetical protein
MSGDVLEESTSSPGTSRAENVLRSRHRRRIVRWLARGAVDRESDLVLRGGDADENEVASDLRETHLPMLEEAGIIEWDRETGRVSKGPNFDDAERLLELMAKDADGPPSGP